MTAFSRIQRRFPEFVEAATPILLAVARTAMKPCGVSPNLENDIVTSDIEGIMTSHALQFEILNELVSFCELLKDKIVSEQAEKQKQLLQQYLGRYILQLLAIAEVCIEKNTCYTLDHLIQLLDCYAFSFHKLLTADLDELVGKLNDDDCETLEEMNLLEIEKGIALAVFRRLCRNGISKTAAESLESLKCKPELSNFECSCALRKAKSLLAISLKGSFWDLAEKGIAVINMSLELCTRTLCCDEDVTVQEALIRETLDMLLQVQEVVIHTPKPDLRKHAFSTLKKIIAQAVPEKARLECLSALIKRCTHPSMVSLLLSCVKDEVAKAWPQKESEENKGQSTSTTVNAKNSLGAIADTNWQYVEEIFTPFDCILGILGSVLRPAGGAPQLPDQLDVVLGALNLYRFLLIREATGGTNYTKVLSISQLNKARTEWLLPLRDYLQILHLKYDEFDDDDCTNVMSVVSSSECVLYRCIELIEEFLSR